MQKNVCTFGSDCWYFHKEKENIKDTTNIDMDESPSVPAGQFECNSCGIEQNSRQSLMKHNKETHTATVLPCESFKAGNCSRIEEDCWFRHPDNKYEILRS